MWEEIKKMEKGKIKINEIYSYTVISLIHVIMWCAERGLK